MWGQCFDGAPTEAATKQLLQRMAAAAEMRATRRTSPLYSRRALALLTALRQGLGLLPTPLFYPDSPKSLLQPFTSPCGSHP